MKKLIIICLALLLTPMALAQDRCEAPVWNVGDKWTYKDATGKTYTNKVVDVKEDVFVMKFEQLQSPVALDRKTMNSKFFIATNGDKILDTTPYRKLFDFPIFVGKKWTDSVSVMPKSRLAYPVPITMSIAFKIENIVEVKTPAGTFKTYVIYLNQRNLSKGANGWMRYWYSPEAKTWVNREIQKTGFWAYVPMYDGELISYELK